MASLVVEIDDFAVAAMSAFRSGGDPLATALFRLTVALEPCAGMAGNDPAGAAWARSYDGAARAALVGMRTVANGSYRLATMFAQTARNYSAAEAASDVSRTTALDVAELPGSAHLSWGVDVPSALGESGGGPAGWSVVQAAVGRVWPNGHQDRLRAAALAWHVASGAVDEAGRVLDGLPDVFAADRLPELSDVELVCGAAAAAAARLADAMNGLTSACDQLADHLDRVHSEIEHELADLLESSLVIEGVGQLLSVLTVGAAEGPTQGVEAGRISVAAARIAALIDEFTALAGRIADSVPTLGSMAESVTSGLQRLFGGPLVPAVVTNVRALPLEPGITETVTTTEMRAAADIASNSRTTKLGLPSLKITRSQIERKFERHAAEFGIRLPRGRGGFDAFERAIREFVESPSVRRIQGTYRRAPAIINLDESTGRMVLQHPDGSFWSCWRLSKHQVMHVVREGSLGGG